MAPEQARDSRATSIQSDMYSLGCTFYYLLTGVPPFPGGDITDKLTRHAKNPPPDVRDLRPDLPAELSAILLKLMAKRPEDRFASYDELIGRDRRDPAGGSDRPPAVTLAPVYGSAGAAPPRLRLWTRRRIHKHGEPHSNGSAEASFPLVSLAELAAEDLPWAARDQPFAGSGARDRPVIERHGSHTGEVGGIGSGASLPNRVPAAPRGRSIPVMAWILPGAILCLAFVILGIGVAQFMGTEERCGSRCAGWRRDGRRAHRWIARPAARARDRRHRTGAAMSTSASEAECRQRAAHARRRRCEMGRAARRRSRPRPRPSSGQLPAAAAAKYLPDWARVPIPERIERAVRDRAPDRDFERSVDRARACTGRWTATAVERSSWRTRARSRSTIFRFSGETRLIRARKGFRPIVRIDRSTGEAVRKQPAVFVLNRKSLILDGIDLIVDARDLSRTPDGPFPVLGREPDAPELLDHDPQPRGGRCRCRLIRTETDATVRPSLIRLEGCLVRGDFTEGFRLSGGPCDVVLRDSMVAARGGPLVRFDGADVAPESRVFVVQSLVAGPGPIIESTSKNAAGCEQAAGDPRIWLGVRPAAWRGHRQRDRRERFESTGRRS